MAISIQPADLFSPAFIKLVETHKALMLEHSPPESSHAVLIDGLRKPDIHVWAMFDGEDLIGSGALKIMSATEAEVKSMHVIADRRSGGLGKIMLDYLLTEARARGLKRLYLETGAAPGFKPARKFYESVGFEYCGPYGDYEEDPNSVFMKFDVQSP